MIILSRERIKSLVLFLLVTISFVLTTRIWFYVAIEGLFDIPPKNQAFEPELTYEKANLFKPSKVVVHTSQNHTLLLNNPRDMDNYNLILNGSKDVLRDWLTNYENYTLSNLPREDLQQIRKGMAVELIFGYSMELENIKGLLGIDKNPRNEITSINSIVIDPFENEIYIVDEKKATIYKYSAAQMPSALKSVIAEIEKRNDYHYLFLNIFNKGFSELYGDYAIAPVTIVTIPALNVKSEIAYDTKLDPKLADAGFFNDSHSDISSTKDENGKITFTDREEETVTIDAEGMLEYYKYNFTSDNAKFIGLNEAIDIATKYVNEHLGFNYDCYLSEVESEIRGGHTFYVISFDYKYNGTPIISEPDAGSHAIEVEILGQEVKRYRRNVGVIVDEGKTVNIKSSVDMLDYIWGDLENYLNKERSETIVILNDLYLAYLMRGERLTPVWVVDVRVEKIDEETKKSKQDDKKLIIGAEIGSLEEGFIFDEK